jgi:hypothetical protein
MKPVYGLKSHSINVLATTATQRGPTDGTWSLFLTPFPRTEPATGIGRASVRGNDLPDPYQRRVHDGLDNP